MITAIARISTRVRSYGQEGAWVAMLAALAVALLAGPGCNLQARDEEQKKPVVQQDNLGPLLEEARALQGEIDEELSAATQSMEAASERANAFVKVADEIETKRLNLRAIKTVLDKCWNRPAEEETCRPPGREYNAAKKVRSKNEATKTFVDDKLAQIEELRPMLREDLSQSAQDLSAAVEEVRAKLQDVRARFDAELAREGVDPQAVDPQVKEMQEIAARLESQLGQAEAKATQVRDTVEPLRISVQEAITESFFVKKRRK